ncbi:RcnB family protein [Chelatococcus composti]|jgi:Predicted integral membrane protein|uniref:Ni/Co efflux regulator RcnB n=1 Tax=Chelatococcus composti TaxID=1743235 RepID=A0A841K8Y0_9HYPH|nr:Ni/Co efflux regulator RcnB [Chelatococcus composti]MBS7736866.1 RcnB family protein [Chelatococcus composti]PZN42629.1 MAG: hypothetical protein DIU59_07230 [Pseudomonadota bacterium]GGG46705.1 membrane protein [Chelatococcus composti]
MKKITLAIVSAAVLVSGVAVAQPGPSHRGPDVRIEHRDMRIDRKGQPPRHAEPQRHAKPRWAKGQRFDWKKNRYREVHARDYRRYHLHAPPRGHRWVEVDGRFLLVNAATGIIASILMMQ